jgi:hypothetical protein
MNWRAKLLGFWNFWPPFFGSGIKIHFVSSDFRQMKIVLKKRWWNGNYVGTAYGGSIFSMTDPFYMVMLLRNLGRDFIVWDKSATIEYLKPGRSHLWAEFKLTDEDLNLIRVQLKDGGKMNWQRSVEVKNDQGATVARVTKILHIRKSETITIVK